MIPIAEMAQPATWRILLSLRKNKFPHPSRFLVLPKTTWKRGGYKESSCKSPKCFRGTQKSRWAVLKCGIHIALFTAHGQQFDYAQSTVWLYTVSKLTIHSQQTDYARSTVWPDKGIFRSVQFADCRNFNPARKVAQYRHCLLPLGRACRSLRRGIFLVSSTDGMKNPQLTE